MITGTQIAVVSAVVAVVAIVAFTLGLFCRRNSDHELIEEYGQELDARQATIRAMSRELTARRPATVAVIPEDDTIVIPSMAEVARRFTADARADGYVVMPPWTADQELQLWVEAAGADLQRYIAALAADAERNAA